MTRTSTLALAICLACAACGGADATTPAASTPTTSTGAGSGQQGDQRGAGGAPGAAGRVAAISGATLQVQSEQTGQVAVTYVDATIVTEQVAGSPADLEVGDCVMVGSDASNDSSRTAGSGDPVQAGTVRITEPVDGECKGGLGGPGGGQRPSGTPPSGAPSAAPSGGFGAAFGEVTDVAGTGFTVAAMNAGTGETDVTYTSTTTWTRAARATAKALAVGQCVSVTGDADDTGAITARTISIQPAVNGECTSGFVRRLDRSGQESS